MKKLLKKIARFILKDELMLFPTLNISNDRTINLEHWFENPSIRIREIDFCPYNNTKSYIAEFMFLDDKPIGFYYKMEVCCDINKQFVIKQLTHKLFEQLEHNSHVEFLENKNM